MAKMLMHLILYDSFSLFECLLNILNLKETDREMIDYA